MWSAITNVYRTSLPLCHVCRNQVHIYRRNVTIHAQQLTWLSTFPCHLKLESAKACLVGEQALMSGKIDVVVRGQGHLNGMEPVERQKSRRKNTDIPNSKDRCIPFKMVFENQKQKISYALHRPNCELNSKLNSRTDYSLDTCLSDILDLKTTEKTDSMVNKLKCLTMFHRRKCSCNISSIKKYSYKLHNMRIGFITTSGVQSNRKTKHCYITKCSFHTSAMKKDSRNGQGGSIRQQRPWRILFFGTDDIALPTLKDLYNDMTSHASRGTVVESLEVVTIHEQRAIRVFAESVQLKIHEWPVAIETEKYDVGVLVSFGHLIPDAVIHMFPYGILNMHPSLLPRWRGASPVIHTILNGDDVTGVSVMEIRPKHFDIGPILLQRECHVPYRCTSLQLADILGRFGASMMLECLKDLPTLERFEHEQDRSGITYAHKLKHKNANIDWENSTAEEIDCQYRAISELMPLKTEMKGQTLKLFDVIDPSLLKDINRKHIRGYHGDIISAEPGTVVYHKPLKCIVVKCKNGLIGFEKVVLRRRLTALDFFNGYINKNTCTKFTSLDNDLNRFIKIEKIPVKSKV